VRPGTGATTRVCYASGSWQLITLCASLRAHHARVPEAVGVQTTIVFSGTGNSPALRRTLERLAELFGHSERIVWIDDLLAELPDFDDAQFEERIGQVRERIGVPHPGEVWVAYPWTGVDRFLLECYLDARVVLFEDGLFTYTRPWGDSDPLKDRLRETLRYMMRRAAADPHARTNAFSSEVRLLGRRKRVLDASYLLLGGALGIPAEHRTVAHIVDPAVLREVLALVPVDLALPPQGERPRALVLGANFSAWKLVPREDELRLYTDVVRKLDEAGYEIWWKDHPRVLEPFHPDIRARLPDIPLHLLHTDHTVPLEAVLLRDPVDLIVAGLSAGLFYTPLISDSRVHVATFAEVARPLLQWPWLEMADLIQANVPTLDAVLAATSRNGDSGTAFPSHHSSPAVQS
jgi:hypothetical protein